nr:hypothetical protein Iba_chr15cCG7860 [Ipomoea batatas]
MGSNGELVAAVEMASSSGGLLLPVRRDQHEAVVRSAVIVLSGKALPTVNGSRHWTVDGGAVLVRAKCFWQRWINVSCLFCKIIELIVVDVLVVISSYYNGYNANKGDQQPHLPKYL